MTQLTLDQRLKEAELQHALDRLHYAPYGTKREMQKRAIAARCAFIKADIDATDIGKGKRLEPSVPGRNGARR